jgi:alpha-L-rhamnosidase
LRVIGPRFEHVREPLGIGTATPRLSWRVETDEADWVQSAYEVEVDGITTRVETDESVLVPWPGEPLASRERRTVRVRVTDARGGTSDWSGPSAVEAGLLHASDWSARLVTPDWDEDTSVAQPCPVLRREFEIGESFERARLYVTAHGLYEAEINGQRVGDHVLAPGWTSYNKRLRYQTFDVTPLLRRGSNVVTVTLADGWYRGKLGWNAQRNNYGDRLALLAQLELDGAPALVTDSQWSAARGPTRSADIYDGETHDARVEPADWTGVRELDFDYGTLFAPLGPPIRCTQTVSPVAISKAPSGRTIVDFGQNLVGRVRITVEGEAGTTITLRHAEVLHEGELCMKLLRAAAATDTYTLRGGGPETWEPRFTFHGFRYADVDGWPGALAAEDLTAVVCHSDMERTGWFECSDDRINKLHENIVWSMRGNFLDVPTDCPQRDERLGWTGDLNVFAPTACFLYDCAGVLQSWLRDLAADQAPDGTVPFVIPNVLPGDPIPTTVWGDVAVVAPSVLHWRFGDLQILRDQYPSMKAWIDKCWALAGDDHLWLRGFQFGDWLDPIAPEDNPAAARTDAHLIASASLCHSLRLLSDAAATLGNRADEGRYWFRAGEVQQAFEGEYVAPSGRVVSDSQTAYALVLLYDLIVDANQCRVAKNRLAQLVERGRHRIGTGFVGTPLVLDALCVADRLDTAYQLLTQTDCPSWLYPVLRGATTIWERWDGLKPDGSLNGIRMNSFNHYALGAVGDWLHRTVAGLAPAAPGYKKLLIKPRPGGGLTYAKASHLTPYGIAESGWRADGDEIEVTAIVPPNTTAVIDLPGREPEAVGSGTHSRRCPFKMGGEEEGQ